jgi:hypothetical protein
MSAGIWNEHHPKQLLHSHRNSPNCYGIRPFPTYKRQRRNPVNNDRPNCHWWFMSYRLLCLLGCLCWRMLPDRKRLCYNKLSSYGIGYDRKFGHYARGAAGGRSYQYSLR